MVDKDAWSASAQLQVLLHAKAPADAVRELVAATPAAASLEFAAPAGWKLFEGELATVKMVFPDGKIKLTRQDHYFESGDLQHALVSWLPLHAAAALNLAPEVVTVLIDANRDAATTPDACGLFPLALALQNNASDEVVMLLFDAARAAVGADGRTALHLVVAASRNIVVIRRVLEANRDAAKTPDAGGKVPFALLLLDASAKLVATFEAKSAAASLAFAAPAGWEPSVGAVVRLVPGVDEKKGLRPGELATVTKVFDAGDIKLTRRRDGKKLDHYFESGDLQHALVSWLPLYAAAALNLAPEVVAVLIDANRDAATTPDACGLLPLARALLNDASDEVIVLLGDAARSAVGTDKRTALHLVVAASRSIAVIHRVLEANRDAAKTPDAGGKVPFALLPSDASAEVASLLFEAGGPRFVWDALDPTTAATSRVELVATFEAKPTAASLAFAAPAGWEPSVGELATVNNIYSDGNIKLTRRRDGKALDGNFQPGDVQHGLVGWLPLYAAAALNLAPEVVAVFIDVNRDAATTPDAGGFPPLVLALQNDASDEVVMLLGEAARAAVGTDGRTALHLVVAASRSIAVIRRVLDANRDAVMTVDADGKLPHHLLQFAHGIELILALFVPHLRDSKALSTLLLRFDSPRLFADLLRNGVDSERLLLAAADLDDLDNAMLCVEKGAGGATPMPDDDRVARAVGLQSSVPAVASFFRLLGVFYGRYRFYEGPPAYRSTTSVVFFAEDLGAHADFEVIFHGADANHDDLLQGSEIDAAAAAVGVDRDVLAFGDDVAVSKEVFVTRCERLLGGGAKGSRRVVLKFMQDESQWRRETAARAGGSLSGAAQGTTTKPDARFIVQSLPGLEDTAAVEAAVEAGEGGLAAFAKRYLPAGVTIGRYVIVMDAADRSLQQIFQQERPDLNGTRTLFQQVTEAMLNTVRLALDGRLRLIDLDCAARIQTRDAPASFLSSKFSSATLPPEMFCALDGAQTVQFGEYWAEERDSSSDVWSKVAPKRDSKGRNFVVKTYRVSSGDEAPVNVGALPYELVKATVA
ncbi:hypothetical protein M885DRAFT_611947, partial [Pelagophyceae sp. CCMP2097]